MFDKDQDIKKAKDELQIQAGEVIERFFETLQDNFNAEQKINILYSVRDRINETYSKRSEMLRGQLEEIGKEMKSFNP